MFNPSANYYTSNAWSGSHIDPGVYFDLFILNASGSNVQINKVYILNRISNPQEVNHIENFCITIGNDDHIYNSTSSSYIFPTGLSDNYTFGYPQYYTHKPGEEWINTTYTSILTNYKYKYNFILGAESKIPLKLNFNPKYRKIDYYVADLIIEYVSIENLTYILKHRVEANYVNIVSEIDKTSFPELIVSVNGVVNGNILTVQ